MRTTVILGATLGLLLVGGCKKGVGLELDMEPPPATVEESQRFSGRVRGVEASLTLNGKPVPLREGRFELTQPLQEGANVLTFALSARPEAGAAPEQKTERFEVKRVDQATFAAEHFYTGSGSLKSLSRRSSGGGLLSDEAEVTLKVDELHGVHFEELSREKRQVRGSLPMELRLSVGQGRARVSVKPEQGPVASAEAAPGAPATLSATAELRLKKYSVRLEALDGQPAKDVELVVSY
ncbi:MAG: hypothetical protein JXB05_12990 [Myxococcaceae bacterium]|nr:hypothetical protein [Myxococcaceae bacterium]